MRNLKLTWQNIFKIALIPLFILFSVQFFLGVLSFCAELLNLNHLTTSVPTLITYLVLPFICLGGLYNLAFIKNKEKIRITLFTFGSILAFLALISLIWQFVNYATGTYWAFLMKGLDALYPFDVLLTNIMHLLIAGLFLYLAITQKYGEFTEFSSKAPLIYDIVRKLVFLFFTGIALYFFGGFLVNITNFYFDDVRKIAIISSFLLIFAMVAYLIYDTYFLRRKNDFSYRKKGSIITGGIILFLNICLLISNLIVKDIYILMMKPLLPLDFMGSLNLAPFLLSLPLIVSFALNTLAYFFPTRKELGNEEAETILS